MSFVLRVVGIMDLKLSDLVVHRAVTLAKESKLITVFVAPSRFPGSFPSHREIGCFPGLIYFKQHCLYFLPLSQGQGELRATFRVGYWLGTHQWHNAVGGASGLCAAAIMSMNWTSCCASGFFWFFQFTPRCDPFSRSLHSIHKPRSDPIRFISLFHP